MSFTHVAKRCLGRAPNVHFRTIFRSLRRGISSQVNKIIIITNSSTRIIKKFVLILCWQVVTESKPPLKIFYGSQTGTATLFSNMLAKEAKDKSWESSVVDMDEYDPVGVCNLRREFSLKS